MADASNVDGEGGWLGYFDESLDGGSDDDGATAADGVAWFALNFIGRSRRVTAMHTASVINPPSESLSVRIIGKDIHYMLPIKHFGYLSKR